MMIYQDVKSSNVGRVGYYKEKKILEMHFKSGGVYQYFDVPERIFKGLVSASSVGKYFHANVREKFSYKQVK